jgi:predicted small lipoprotein YifL
MSGRQFVVLAAALIVMAGCGKREETTAPTKVPDAAKSAAPEPLFDPIGTWTVTGYSMPGISAMTEGEAKAHDGQTVKFAAEEALSNGERCAAPKYPGRSVDTEEFLAAEFNLPPESLKPVAGKDSVTVVEVSCDDAPWTAFGSLVIAIDADHVVTPWDGVFFELERTRG